MTHKQNITLKICSPNKNVSNLSHLSFSTTYHNLLQIENPEVTTGNCQHFIIMSLFLSFSSLNPQSNIMTDKTNGACFLFYDKKKFGMKIFISKKENLSFPGLWWVFLVCWYNYIVHTCIPLDQYSSRHVLFFLSPNIWVPLIFSDFYKTSLPIIKVNSLV